MKLLKRLLREPLKPVPTSLAIFLLVIALLGFADSTYLTIEHYKGVIPPCTIVSGCEAVLTSTYSVVLGIPVSLLGAIYYFLILVGVFAYIEGRNEKLLRMALLVTVLGFIFSMWFLIVQAFILQAWCLYCLISTGTSTILFVTAVVIFSKYRTPDTLTS